MKANKVKTTRNSLSGSTKRHFIQFETNIQSKKIMNDLKLIIRKRKFEIFGAHEGENNHSAFAF